MLINILRSILRRFTMPIQTRDINEWARLEFGRDVQASDLEGRAS